MDKGTYVSASGGILQLRNLEVTSNNLANTNTVGFKKQVLVAQSESFEDTLAATIKNIDPYAKGDHERAPGVGKIEIKTDFSTGAIQYTGSNLDVALRNPNEFFVIETPDGPQYTRAGNFTLNDQGQIVTVDGMPVTGDGGAINAVGGAVAIQSNGDVTIDGNPVGRLQVVRFEDPNTLERAAGVRFKGGPPPEQVEPNLATQSLEMANVSIVTSMIDLVSANRAFQLYTKTTQTIEGLNRDSIQDLGRSR